MRFAENPERQWKLTCKDDVISLESQKVDAVLIQKEEIREEHQRLGKHADWPCQAYGK